MTLATLPADLPFFLTEIPPMEFGYLLTLRHGVTQSRAHELLRGITGPPASAVRHVLDECDAWRHSPDPLTADDIRTLERKGRLIPWAYP